MSKQALKILFLAAEAEPFVKIGGLGDVAGTLPSMIKSVSNIITTNGYDVDIRLVIPFHGAIQRQDFRLQPICSFNVPHVSGNIPGQALLTNLKDIPVYFIAGPPIPGDAPVYSEDSAKDGFKFTFFSLAALELARWLDWKPDILHANDWHSAPAIIYIKTKQDPFFSDTAAIMGLHNLPFMGENAGPALAEYGLSMEQDSPLPWWAKNMPLPLGLLLADHIITVSPTYAREIMTPNFGSGLEDFLKGCSDKISGILNGIDINIWNPLTDKAIKNNYSIENLSQRQKNKIELIEEFKLNPDPAIPLLTLITRFDFQKGIDLLPVALKFIEDDKWQIIILGTGNSDLEEQIQILEKNYADRFRAAIRFDSNLSHRLYAGADAIIIPSRYEPCGLNQMIAMNYGCIPIANATGGLKDTIHNHNAKVKTGFLFTKASSKNLSASLRRAITAYEKKDTWYQLQVNGMLQDFSWENSAIQYLKLYQSLTKNR